MLSVLFYILAHPSLLEVESLFKQLVFLGKKGIHYSQRIVTKHIRWNNFIQKLKISELSKNKEVEQEYQVFMLPKTAIQTLDRQKLKMILSHSKLRDMYKN